jgi:hypothetical protein
MMFEESYMRIFTASNNASVINDTWLGVVSRQVSRFSLDFVDDCFKHILFNWYFSCLFLNFEKILVKLKFLHLLLQTHLPILMLVKNELVLHYLLDASLRSLFDCWSTLFLLCYLFSEYNMQDRSIEFESLLWITTDFNDWHDFFLPNGRLFWMILVNFLFCTATLPASDYSAGTLNS